jgi:amino acid transporter
LIPNQNIFWAFFSLNVVALLGSYILMFPSFSKLRKIDPKAERPFKVPGNKFMISLMTWIPVTLLVVTVIMSAVPLNGSAEEINGKVPILIGTIITLILGEICIRIAEKHGDKKAHQEASSHIEGHSEHALEK